MGEPTHGVGHFLELRNDVFRCLVHDHGYRAIALETDIAAAEVVDEYVGGADLSLDQVMETGFSHGFGQAATNRALVSWLRDHNSGRPRLDQVRLYGFDAPLEMGGAPSPRAPIFLGVLLPEEAPGEKRRDAVLVGGRRPARRR